jgi:hypothetical protein
MDFRFFLRDAKNSMGEVSKLQQGSEGVGYRAKPQEKWKILKFLVLFKVHISYFNHTVLLSFNPMRVQISGRGYNFFWVWWKNFLRGCKIFLVVMYPLYPPPTPESLCWLTGSYQSEKIHGKMFYFACSCTLVTFRKLKILLDYPLTPEKCKHAR